MPTLNREDWYGLSRELDWTPSYLPCDVLFPRFASDPVALNPDVWQSWSEPYPLSYREYVDIQRRKDEALSAAAGQSPVGNYLEAPDARWRAIITEHYGIVALSEYFAGIAQARLGRWAPCAAWRNVATLGVLDEIRHSQLQLSFPDAYARPAARSTWAGTMCQSEEWATIAARSILSDLFLAASAIEVAIAEIFVSDIAFANLEFLGVASDSLDTAKPEFSSLIQSIQTDEVRSSRRGGSIVEILREHDRAYAQRVIDKCIWRAWKFFSLMAGLSMDYYMPLEHRRYSFKEFMEQCVLGQFAKFLLDSGMELPWHWDHLVEEIEDFHHSMHLAAWTYRRALWWEPVAGVSARERRWLAGKYPAWSDNWSWRWDVVSADASASDAHPAPTPLTCNTCQLPLTVWPGRTSPRRFTSRGRVYFFCSAPCEWIFEQEPEKYRTHLSLSDRVVAGASALTRRTSTEAAPE